MDLKERIQGLLRTSDTRARKSPIATLPPVRFGMTAELDQSRFVGMQFQAELLRTLAKFDPRLNPGHNWMEIRATSLQPNVSGVPLTVPDAVRQTTIPLWGVGAEIHLPEVTLAVAR